MSTLSPANNAKNRTAALPHVGKNAVTGGRAPAKPHDVTELVDAMWNGTVFGPYLIPLSRRAE